MRGVVDAELVKCLVLLIPHVARQIETANKHEHSVLLLSAILLTLAWISCAVQPSPKHAVTCKLQRQPFRLDVRNSCFVRPMEQERVPFRLAGFVCVEMKRRPLDVLPQRLVVCNLDYSLEAE